MQRPPLIKKLCLNLNIKRCTQSEDQCGQNQRSPLKNRMSPEFRSSPGNENTPISDILRNRVPRKSFDSKHRSQIHKSPYEAKKAYEDVIYQKQQAFLRTHKVFIDKRQAKKSQHVDREIPKLNKISNQGQKQTLRPIKSTLSLSISNSPLAMTMMRPKSKKNLIELQMKSAKTHQQMTKQNEQNQLSYRKIRKINGSRYIVLATIDQNRLFSIELACMQNGHEYYIKIPLEQASLLLKQCYSSSLEVMMDNIAIDDSKRVCYLKYQKQRNCIIKSRLPLINETPQEFQESFKGIKSFEKNFCHSHHVNITNTSEEKERVEDHSLTEPGDQINFP